MVEFVYSDKKQISVIREAVSLLWGLFIEKYWTLFKTQTHPVYPDPEQKTDISVLIKASLSERMDVDINTTYLR